MKKILKQRQCIDAIDSKITALILKRCQATNTIFEIKKESGHQTVDSKREKVINDKFYKELKGVSTKQKTRFFVEALLKINKNYPKK